MEKKQLTENDQAFRKYLMKEVDYWERERWLEDRDPQATNKYHIAKEELKEFIKELRLKGYKI